MGRFCARVGIAPELVLFSPFVRAEETARAFAEAWPPDLRVLQAASFAASGMHPGEAYRELLAYGRFDSLMLVGHQPDLGLLAAVLLGLPEAGILSVGKATLIGLRTQRLMPRSGSLEFCLPVELMT